MKTTNYTINDLPRYSSWPARLLGIEPWEQRCKTPKAIQREYEMQKGKSQLKKLTSGRLRILRRVSAALEMVLISFPDWKRISST